MVFESVKLLIIGRSDSNIEFIQTLLKNSNTSRYIIEQAKELGYLKDLYSFISPNMVIIDLDSFEEEPLKFAKESIGLLGECPVIAITEKKNKTLHIDLIANGISTVLIKSKLSPGILSQAIHAITNSPKISISRKQAISI